MKVQQILRVWCVVVWFSLTSIYVFLISGRNGSNHVKQRLCSVEKRVRGNVKEKQTRKRKKYERITFKNIRPNFFSQKQNIN